MFFYNKSVSDLEHELKSNIQNGLTEKEAQNRLKKYGQNILPQATKIPIYLIFLKQFKNPLIYILLFAGTLKIILGSHFESLLIFIILLVNGIIGTFLEYKANTVIESLKKFIKTEAIVLRDGKKKVINESDLVIGDIIILEEGFKIPADARIAEENNLTLDEAILTGESTAVAKKIENLKDKKLPLHDQKNMVFTGTYILSGIGKAIVVATGQSTEIGKLNKFITHIDQTSPLENDINWLSHIILITVTILSTIFFITGYFWNQSISELLFALIAVSISAIPEGLPIILTIVLARGAYQMAQKNVLVKRIKAIETLGRVEVIVIDKTGTLTRNQMTVTDIYTTNNNYFSISGEGYSKNGEIQPHYSNDSALIDTAIAGLLLNHAIIIEENNIFRIKGEPIQAAMYFFGLKAGYAIEDISEQYKSAYEIPFNPEVRLHIGFFENDNKIIIYMFGSPEMVFDRCKNISQETKYALDKYLDEGLRLIALAKKEIKLEHVDQTKDPYLFYLNLANDMQLVSIIGMQDAIRGEVKEVIQKVQDAGFQIIMATGDHKDTAMFVAKKTGLLKSYSKIINGDEIDKLSQKQLIEILPDTAVFSRVTPLEKVKIVDAFHKLDKIVSMTGDGVNDVPSILAADVGIAMGTIGTEVTREAADIVLLDDSLKTIVDGIEWGRHIFLTIRRVILYLLTTNLAEILLMGIAIVLGFPLPLITVQLLWINLVTDGFLDIALTLEPKQKNLLFFKNFNKIKLFDKNFLIKTLLLALPMTIGSFFVFINFYKIDIILARTVTLVTLSAFQWFNAWNMKSEFSSIFKVNIFHNLWLVFATIVVIILQIAAIHIPLLNQLLGTVPLSILQWILCLTVASTIIFFDEFIKWISKTNV